MVKKTLSVLGIIAVVIMISFLFRQMNNKEDSSVKKEDNQLENRSSIFMNKNPERLDEITEQLHEMTIEEKIGQLFIGGIDGSELSKQSAKLIKQQHLGGVILFSDNMEEPTQTLQLINDLKEANSNNDIPLFISVDQEGGRVTRLPGLRPVKSAGEIGKTDAAYAYDHGELLAKQLKAFGFQLNFAPVLDINSNPQNKVIGDRAFGNKASFVGDIGTSVMKGMQEEQVIAAVKHFPGHGDTLEDSHEELPVLDKSKAELMANELIPFQQAIDEGADTVLMGHILVKGLNEKMPASLSAEAVELLRNDLGFNGVVITDDLTMGAIADHYNMGDASLKALQAGVDIIMIAHGSEMLQEGIDGVIKALEAGQLTEDQVDEHVRRILILKRKYNLHDDRIHKVNMKSLNKDMDQLYERKK